MQMAPMLLMVSGLHPRLRREARTIEAMIRISCRNQHGGRGRQLCSECDELRAYALQRLEKCPFQEKKTTCVKCPVHCYRPGMRARVRAVMRYAGPRMLWRHPGLAIMHLLVDSRRQAPGRARKLEET